MATVQSMRCDLTQDEVKAALDYDPETGVFTWRFRPCMRRGWNAKRAGKVAGTTMASGYRAIVVNDKHYLAHRLAWLYVYGAWPAQQVDHVNLKRDDNRIANLREATAAENKMNRFAQRNSISGIKGAHWHKPSGLWHARIRVSGREHSLGYFHIPEEAGEAYKDAAKRLHGKFARTC